MSGFVWVNDSLPKISSDVEIMTIGGNMKLARYAPHKGHFEFVDMSFNKIRGVTKWRYLQEEVYE